MKKLILSAFSVIAIASIVFISCKPKNDSDAITPTYKDEATGTGGNPNITNVTTTGTIATTGTQQSSVMTGIGQGVNWSSVGCSGQSCITVSNTNLGTTVTICFAGPPAAGTYQLVNSVGLVTPTTACLTVYNPTGQNTGTAWYSSSGTVVVTVNGSAITASFSNIPCYETPGSFYSVTVSGQVGCL